MIMATSVAPQAARPLPPPTVPPCRSLGAQCKSLRVTLRIGELEEGADSLDHEATWLLGHTQQMDFLELWEGEGDLYVEAVLHVPCKYLHQEGNVAQCRAHGFRGPAPRGARREPQPLQLGGDRFVVVEERRNVVRSLPLPARSLPVLESGGSVGENPCASAPCRTADNTRKAACCRDLQVEIMCTRAQRRLESLVRSRRSPYLCKIERAGDYSLEVEMISACGYLGPDGVACSLHGRHRADGRTAKPDLCFEWPPKNRGLHPGCVFGPRRRSAART
jgi:Fe-S-cluster containining protein